MVEHPQRLAAQRQLLQILLHFLPPEERVSIEGQDTPVRRRKQKSVPRPKSTAPS